MRVNSGHIIGLLLAVIGLLSARDLYADAPPMSSSQRFCAELAARMESTELKPEPVAAEAPKYWKKGLKTDVGLNQTALVNWAAGGSGIVGLSAYLDATADYSKGKFLWENRAQAAYGFVYSMNKNEQFRFKKNDDRLILDSKAGYSVIQRLYVSSLFNFTSQFAPGYPYSGENQRVSMFMSPANLSVGAGVDYKPFTILSIYASPATGKFVFVLDSALRTKYGNEANQPVRSEFGAQVKFDLNYKFKTITLKSQLTLFSNYLNHPENIVVNWDINFSVKLWKYLDLSFVSNLIYDDKVLIQDPDDSSKSSPKVQWKEVSGLKFTYTFGEYTKR